MEGLPFTRQTALQEFQHIQRTEQNRVASKLVFAPTAIANPQLNRYSNVLPFEQTLLQLSTNEYVNASRISVNGNSYIAAQGPLPHTVPAFWRAVLESKAAVIVMLTNLDDRGVPKCHKYWPSTTGSAGAMNLAPDLVLTLETEQVSEAMSETIIRTIIINGTHKVVQLHFTQWPDHQGADTHSILRLVDLVNQLSSASTTSTNCICAPVVVHCSAGVGRTGTFITIDSVLKRMAGQHEFQPSEVSPIFECVMSLREQRVMMVQTFEQYLMCYEAVALRLNEGKVGTHNDSRENTKS